MSVENWFETLTKMDKTSVSDGMGGFIEEFKEGAEFKGSVVMDNTTQGRIAEKQGVTSIYTITVKKSVPLSYGDIIKRKSNNNYYRITSVPDENQTPARASLDMKQAQAERWTM